MSRLVPSNCILRPSQIQDLRRLAWFDRQFAHRHRPDMTRRWRNFAAFAFLGFSIFVALKDLRPLAMVMLGFAPIYLILAWLGWLTRHPPLQDWVDYWVIESEQDLVACAKWRHYDSYSHLVNLYVEPKWRNRGLGASLVERLLGQTTQPIYVISDNTIVGFFRRFAIFLMQSMNKNLSKSCLLVLFLGIVQLPGIAENAHSPLTPAHQQQSQEQQAEIVKLVKQLRSDNENARGKASGELGNMPESTYLFSQLSLLSQDPDNSIRGWIAYALGSMGKSVGSVEFAIPQLIRLTQDPHPEVRTNAIYSLGRIVKLSQDIKEPEQLLNVQEFLRPIIPHLMSLLKDPDSNIRASVGGALRSMEARGESAVPLILPLLQDPNSNIRHGAAYALGSLRQFATSTIILQLIPLMKDSDQQVRTSASSALSLIGYEFRGKIIDSAPSAIPMLTALLKEPEVSTRQNALYILRYMGEAAKPAIPDLIPLLKDPNVDIQFDTAHFLKRLGQETPGFELSH
jgi:HEAT repeat protein/GNAT superfamily N-acetyltransferase